MGNNIKKGSERVPVPLCSTTSFPLRRIGCRAGQIAEDSLNLPKIVEHCRMLSYFVENCRMRQFGCQRAVVEHKEDVIRVHSFWFVASARSALASYYDFGQAYSLRDTPNSATRDCIRSSYRTTLCMRRNPPSGTIDTYFRTE